jgi:mercuric ion binding protein
MSCAACAARLKRGLEKIDGVVHVDVSFEKANARIRFVPSKTNPGHLSAAIRGMDLTPGTPIVATGS